jgi:acid phosphatase type 7
MRIFSYTFIAILLLALQQTADAQSIVRGPYLQAGSKTEVTIRWRTDIATTSKVEIGNTSGTYPTSFTDNTSTTEHIIRVTGLIPNTKYYYTTGTTTTVLQGNADNFFVTAPADTSTRKITAAVFGDCGRNDNNYQTNSLNQYLTHLQNKGMKAADLMLLLGDNAYQNGTDAEYTSGFFGAYQSTILKNHILFPTPGNHDYANDAGRQDDHAVPYYDIFTVPDAGQSGGVASNNKAYYSYNWGNIHFLSLDSYGEEDAGTTRLYDTNGKQVQWIKNDLAANTKKWTIAYWHHPPYTMGNHNSDNESELVAIRQNFIQILERNGVDLILCGHSHNYERSYLLKSYTGNEAAFNAATHTADSSSAKYDEAANSCPYIYPSGKKTHGTVYIVAGSAGASGGVQAGYPHNAMPFSYNDGGMLFLEIEDNRLDAKFIRQDGVIADKFTIIKDANRRDTFTITPGSSIELSANWLGGYVWSTNATSKKITVSPTANTLYSVKDSSTNTCINNEFYVKVQFPAGIQSSTGKDGVIVYPVPANGMLYAKTPSIINKKVIAEIISFNGQVLQSDVVNTDSEGLLRIDISHLPKVTQLILRISREVNTYSIPFTVQ